MNKTAWHTIILRVNLELEEEKVGAELLHEIQRSTEMLLNVQRAIAYVVEDQEHIVLDPSSLEGIPSVRMRHVLQATPPTKLITASERRANILRRRVERIIDTLTSQLENAEHKLYAFIPDPPTRRRKKSAPVSKKG